MKCEQCRQIIWKKDLEENLNVCPKCDKHFRIDARTRLSYLYDDGKFETFDTNLASTDPLKFTDLKPYAARLKRAQKDTGLNDAIINAKGNIYGPPGDHERHGVQLHRRQHGLGSRRGDHPRRGTSHRRTYPLVIISASGGARMMEGVISLMQLAKISSALARMESRKGPIRLGVDGSHHRRRNRLVCHAR